MVTGLLGKAWAARLAADSAAARRVWARGLRMRWRMGLSPGGACRGRRLCAAGCRWRVWWREAGRQGPHAALDDGETAQAQAGATYLYSSVWSAAGPRDLDRKSTRLNSSHLVI